MRISQKKHAEFEVVLKEELERFSSHLHQSLIEYVQHSERIELMTFEYELQVLNNECIELASFYQQQANQVSKEPLSQDVTCCLKYSNSLRQSMTSLNKKLMTSQMSYLTYMEQLFNVFQTRMKKRIEKLNYASEMELLDDDQTENGSVLDTRSVELQNRNSSKNYSLDLINNILPRFQSFMTSMNQEIERSERCIQENHEELDQFLDELLMKMKKDGHDLKDMCQILFKSIIQIYAPLPAEENYQLCHKSPQLYIDALLRRFTGTCTSNPTTLHGLNDFIQQIETKGFSKKEMKTKLRNASLEKQAEIISQAVITRIEAIYQNVKVDYEDELDTIPEKNILTDRFLSFDSLTNHRKYHQNEAMMKLTLQYLLEVLTNEITVMDEDDSNTEIGQACKNFRIAMKKILKADDHSSNEKEIQKCSLDLNESLETFQVFDPAMKASGGQNVFVLDATELVKKLIQLNEFHSIFLGRLQSFELIVEQNLLLLGSLKKAGKIREDTSTNIIRDISMHVGPPEEFIRISKLILGQTISMADIFRFCLNKKDEKSVDEENKTLRRR